MSEGSDGKGREGGRVLMVKGGRGGREGEEKEGKIEFKYEGAWGDRRGEFEKFTVL